MMDTALFLVGVLLGALGGLATLEAYENRDPWLALVGFIPAILYVLVVMVVFG